jgi:hypothetical protein
MLTWWKLHPTFLKKVETIIGGLFQTHPVVEGTNQAVAADPYGRKDQYGWIQWKRCLCGDQLCRNLKAEGMISVC